MLIGETKRMVKKCFTEHEASVRLQKTNPIGLHWNRHDHSRDNIIFLQILETLPSDPELHTYAGLDIMLFCYLSDSNLGHRLGQVYGLNLHTAQNM